MKTLEIKNGDLAIGPGGYSTLSGPAKIKQDLAVAVREPVGCDRFHPRWGTVLQDLVGDIQGEDIEAKIISEINRLVRNYTAVQDDRMAADYGAGVRPRYATNEIISTLLGVDVQQRDDAVYIRVRLQTMSGDTVNVVTSVGTL